MYEISNKDLPLLTELVDAFLEQRDLFLNMGWHDYASGINYCAELVHSLVYELSLDEGIDVHNIDMSELRDQ